MLLMAGSPIVEKLPRPYVSVQTVKTSVWKLLLAGRSEAEAWEQVWIDLI